MLSSTLILPDKVRLALEPGGGAWGAWHGACVSRLSVWAASCPPPLEQEGVPCICSLDSDQQATAAIPGELQPAKRCPLLGISSLMPPVTCVKRNGRVSRD